MAQPLGGSFDENQDQAKEIVPGPFNYFECAGGGTM
jgi:hypothetical protein